MSTASPTSDEARRRLAATFRAGELVWLAGEQYDPNTQMWNIDVLRQGPFGRWARQRHRYDEPSGVLYFFGESALSDADFRTARTTATRFPLGAAER